MGVQHAELPIHGVQFHPESILTEGGHRMLANWLGFCGEAPAEQLVSLLEQEVAIRWRRLLREAQRDGAAEFHRGAGRWALSDDRVGPLAAVLRVGSATRPPVQPSTRRLGSASTQNCPIRSGITNWLPRDTCTWIGVSTGTVSPAGGGCRSPDRGGCCRRRPAWLREPDAVRICLQTSNVWPDAVGDGLAVRARTDDDRDDVGDRRRRSWPAGRCPSPGPSARARTPTATA